MNFKQLFLGALFIMTSTIVLGQRNSDQTTSKKMDTSDAVRLLQDSTLNSLTGVGTEICSSTTRQL
jgi:4-hydroxy-3-methylbut-2-enyl diphosphate reductase IspH